MDLHRYDRQNSFIAWADAFTLQQEAAAEAKANPQLRAAVQDALKQAESALKEATTDEARKEARRAVDNQKQVLQALTFDGEAFRAGMLSWKVVRADLAHIDWDMTKEIQGESLPGDKVKFWQAGSLVHAEWTGAEARVAMLFFSFVRQHQAADPMEYTRRMLAEQGITKDNFHLHADKLAISNPWAEQPLIIKP